MSSYPDIRLVSPDDLGYIAHCRRYASLKNKPYVRSGQRDKDRAICKLVKRYETLTRTYLADTFPLKPERIVRIGEGFRTRYRELDAVAGYTNPAIIFEIKACLSRHNNTESKYHEATSQVNTNLSLLNRVYTNVFGCVLLIVRNHYSADSMSLEELKEFLFKPYRRGRLQRIEVPIEPIDELYRATYQNSPDYLTILNA